MAEHGSPLVITEMMLSFAGESFQLSSDEYGGEHGVDKVACMRPDPEHWGQQCWTWTFGCETSTCDLLTKVLHHVTLEHGVGKS